MVTSKLKTSIRRSLTGEGKGPVVVSIASTAVFWFAQTLVRSRYGASLLNGLYFQATPSDDMMQTIELKSLVSTPFRALWYLHYQPPGFDLLRLVLSLPEKFTSSEVSTLAVDARLYVLYAIFYGTINGVVFYWARKASESTWISGLTVLIWAAYPGNVAMATYLDSMYLSVFLIVLSGHLWVIGILKSRSRLILGSGLTLIVLSWVRTSLQLPLLLLLLAVGGWVVLSRLSLNWSWSTRVAVGGLAMLSVALPLKQYLLFGMTSTTSSSGHHLVGMIRYQPEDSELLTQSVSPRLVTNGTKFENKFNNASELIRNEQLTSLFIRRLSEDPIGSAKAALITAHRSITKGASATQNYQPNALVNRMPWSEFSEALFSGSSYVLFVVFGLGFFVCHIARKRRCSLLWLLQLTGPIALFILLQASVILFGSMRYSSNPAMGLGFGWEDGFTWTESNRLKFLLEPLLLPVSALGLLLSGRWIVQRMLTGPERRGASSSNSL